MKVKGSLTRTLIECVAARVCYTFALSLFSLIGGGAAMIGIVFMAVTVDYASEAALMQDIVLCTLLVVLAAFVHGLLFGLPRLWGDRWELKPLRVLNDTLSGTSLGADTPTPVLIEVSACLDRLPLINTATAAILGGGVLVIALLQEVLVTRNWSNGLYILAGGLIAAVLYLMFTQLITEMLTYDLRREARCLLAEREALRGDHAAASLMMKAVYCLVLLFISIVLCYGVTTTQHGLPAAAKVGFAIVLPMLVAILFYILIGRAIGRPLREVQQAGALLSESQPARLISGSIDREFCDIALTLYDTSREILDYRLRLKALNSELETKVEERTVELKTLNENMKHEITERRKIEVALRESESQYAALVEYAKDGVIIYQGDTLQFANKAVSVISGYAPEEMKDLSLKEIVTPESMEVFEERLQAIDRGKTVSNTFEVRLRCKDGSLRDVEISSGTILYRGDNAAMAIIRDITDRKRVQEALLKSEEKYKALSITDELTKLYNVRYFYSQLKNEAARADRYHSPLSIILMDIDDFKRFNDTWGHLQGDKVLEQLGATILACQREMDSAYRYGGEEFTVILPETTGQEAIAVADRLRKAFAEAVILPDGSTEVHMSISLGISQYREGENISLFLERADRNMYIAKEQGKNRIYYCSGSERELSAL